MLIVARSSGRPEQVVAQGVGHELVELVADLVAHPHHDAARGLLRGERPVILPVGVGRRVEEAVEQRDRVVLAVRVGARDGLGEHRVAETVDGVGELGLDRRVDVGVVDVERLDGRLHLAAELLEDQVLVLHLGHEPGRLEEPLAVPAVGTGCRLPLRQGCDALGRRVVGSACS